MIGFLCNNNRERVCAVQFHSLIKKIKDAKDEPIIVFTIFNVDLNSNTVTGTLISGKETERISVSIPKIIFNFSIQRQSEAIKIRRLLEDKEDIELINNVNIFDQSMIMEMLSSSTEYKSSLLNYHIYNKEYRNYEPEREKNYVIIPSKGVNLSQLYFISSDRGLNCTDYMESSRKKFVRDCIDASLYQSRWIFLETPDLMVHDKYPVVLRSFLQKSPNKHWMLLCSKLYPETHIISDNIISEANKGVLKNIEYVNHFLPDLGHCFIDSLIGCSGKAYFLQMGGIDQKFFEENEDEIVSEWF